MADRTTPTPWRALTGRERLRLISFALLPVTFLLLLAEVLSWLAIDRQFHVAPATDSARAEYVFRMGRYPWSVNTRVELNALGFPDEEFATTPAKGDCFHIAVIGDSYAFGDGVDGPESFVSVLRARLRHRAGPGACVRVFNVGERAASIEQQLRNFRRVRELLRPDAVVLTQYQNDLTDLTKSWFASQAGRDTTVTGTTWKPRFRLPAVDPSLVKWLSYRLIAAATMANVRVDLLSRWSIMADDSRPEHAAALVSLYTTVFDSLVTEVRASGASFATVVLPSKLDVLAGRSPEEPFFTGLASARDVPVLSLFPTFDETRRPYPFLLYDGHLNRAGNALVASRLEAWLLDGSPPPIPGLPGRRLP